MNESPTPRTDAFIAGKYKEGTVSSFSGLCRDLAEWSRNLERELGILKSKREAAVRYGADSLESDSIENSCNCLEKTPEARFHKPGCKYRLISERNAARRECERLRSVLTLWYDAYQNAYPPVARVGDPHGKFDAAAEETKKALTNK